MSSLESWRQALLSASRSTRQQQTALRRSRQIVMTPRRHSSTRPSPVATGVTLMAIVSGLLLGGPASAATHRQSHAALRRSTLKRCPATGARATGHTARAARKAHGARTVKSCAPKRTHSGRGANTGGLPGNWRPVVSSPLAPGSSEAHAEESPARARHKGAPGTGLGGLPQEEGDVLTDPIDSRFLTKDPFGASSFWIQPWRAYLDTWPSSTLLSSLGINFNVGVAQAEAVAQLLQDSGFTLARREIPWGALSYEDPTRIQQRAEDRQDPGRPAQPRPAPADPAERQQRPAGAGQADHPHHPRPRLARRDDRPPGPGQRGRGRAGQDRLRRTDLGHRPRRSRHRRRR